MEIREFITAADESGNRKVQFFELEKIIADLQKELVDLRKELEDLKSRV